MTAWETILKLIKEKKMRKVDFVDKMAISRQTLDNWLKEKSSPDHKDIKKMSIILDEFKAGETDTNTQNGIDNLLNELKEAYNNNNELKDKLIKMQEEKIKQLERELDDYKAGKRK
jgi:transcriptional regulator with XRE-family HTH domain